MSTKFHVQAPIIRWPSALPPLNSKGLVAYPRGYKHPVRSGVELTPKNDPNFGSCGRDTGVRSGAEARRPAAIHRI